MTDTAHNTLRGILPVQSTFCSTFDQHFYFNYKPLEP